MKVFWVFNHPAPYKVNFFNLLGKEVDLTVYFERNKENDRPDSFYYENQYNFKTLDFPGINIGRIDNYHPGVVKHLLENEYDAIVINGWRTLTEMKIIKSLQKYHIPYVFAINGGIIPQKENAVKRKLKTKHIANAAYYLAPDQNSAAYLIHYGAKEQNIHLYPYSSIFEKEINHNPLSEDEKFEIKKKYGLEEKQIYISPSLISKRKNIDSLLKAWENVHPNKVLLIAGNIDKNHQLKLSSKNLELNNVKILPFINHDALLTLFRAAEYCLFPTHYDIYGHVVNEALSQGLPVIGSTGSNAVKNLIKNKENGFIIDYSNPDELLKIINQEKDEMMHFSCVETAKKNTLEAMVQDHLSFFKELVK